MSELDRMRAEVAGYAYDGSDDYPAEHCRDVAALLAECDALRIKAEHVAPLLESQERLTAEVERLRAGLHEIRGLCTKPARAWPADRLDALLEGEPPC